MAHITQSHIARELKVTRITVSKALRDHPDISPKMKARVRATAERLGYTPNLIARNLTARKTLTLGVVVPDLENSFFAYATDSIIDAAADRNYNVIVTVSRESQLHEAANLQRLLGMRVDGLLVCVSQETRDRSAFERIRKAKMPLVFFDRALEEGDFRSVVFDDRNGARAAMESILAEGYTKVAHVAGYPAVSVGRDRARGYREAMKAHGIPLNPGWIIEGGFEVKDGYNAFMALHRMNDLPEVIFVVNDRAALGVYRAAQEVGVAIPQDVGVAAFGFKETAQTFTPALSVVHQDPRRLGEAATEMLLATIDGAPRAEQRQVTLDEEFLWNRSLLRRSSTTPTSFSDNP